MTIAAADFRTYVINPALQILVPAGIPVTQVAADLLMVTAAMETDLGTWLTQVGGPALGVFQIEPATLSSLLGRLSTLETVALNKLRTSLPITSDIEGNMLCAAAVCRLFYWHNSMPLPADTINGLWSMYKAVWNTPAGAATFTDFTTALKLTDLGDLPVG